MTNISIFASGGGSNALKIIKHFEGSSTIQIKQIISNNEAAGVLKIAQEYHIASHVINKSQLHDGRYMDEILIGIDYIVLAGFLKKIPEYLIKKFENKIFNTHPSLLPKYGGKGMYGMNVHAAIVKNNEKISGMTIHLVNEEYDKGPILFQKSCIVEPMDTAELVALKVLALEHENYAKVIEEYISQF
ncbi:MAG: hypothetical protein RLZZ546_1989 [Bacteroidota bacterium]|jgi:phosphoribosylglycinamide formyltransferase-1